MAGTKTKSAGPKLCVELLVSPMLQWGTLTPSMIRYRHTPTLSLVQLAHAWQLYLENVATDAQLHRASPGFISKRGLGTLGRVHVIGAEVDVLRDEVGVGSGISPARPLYSAPPLPPRPHALPLGRDVRGPASRERGECDIHHVPRRPARFLWRLAIRRRDGGVAGSCSGRQGRVSSGSARQPRGGWVAPLLEHAQSSFTQPRPNHRPSLRRRRSEQARRSSKAERRKETSSGKGFASNCPPEVAPQWVPVPARREMATSGGKTSADSRRSSTDPPRNPPLAQHTGRMGRVYAVFDLGLMPKIDGKYRFRKNSRNSAKYEPYMMPPATRFS